MRNKIILIVFLGIQIIGLAQQEDKVLLTINNQPVYVSEFKTVYEKNLDQIKEEEKDIDKNLELFINYKLKLLDAYQLKLDTSKAYINELNSYKNQLMIPYLYDKDFKEKLLKQSYDRTLEEIRASHILITTKKADSLAIKQKLKTIRERIEKGEPFEKLAKEFSDDPSVKVNGGDLGYFSAFRMVYQFEEAAYNTKIGTVSEPFKTRFGYHILKVTDKRKSKGEFEVAHILIRDNEKEKNKQEIEAIYSALEKGKSFEEIAKTSSHDKGSAMNGGKLPKFGAGRMVLPFENAVLKLKKEGDFSKPFKTQFGWHIVKLIKKHPVKSFSEMKEELESRIRSSNRENLSTQKLISNLKKKYQTKEHNASYSFINSIKKNKEIKFTERQKKEAIFTIEEKTIALNSFLNYIENKRYLDVHNLWEKFKNEEVLNYYKENLSSIYPEYKNTLQEYKDGLLLFDLMKLKIWDNSQKNASELEIFFKNNKKKYQEKTLEEVKGNVISDYQQHLEKEWIDKLRDDNKIKVKKRVLKDLKKHYTK